MLSAEHGSGSRMQFDHIGIVVSELADGRAVMGTAFGIRHWTIEFEDPVNDVYVQFGRCSSAVCYELIAPLSAASPVWPVIRRGVNTVNHVAYLVSSLAEETKRLGDQGFTIIGQPKPAIAYGGKPIQFVTSPSRLLFELIEAPGHRHEFLG